MRSDVMTDQTADAFDQDGIWLLEIKQRSWEPLLDLAVDLGEQTVDVSPTSCFKNSNGDTFCVLRSVDITQDTIAYLGAYIPKIHSEQIFAIVARTEGLDGRTIGRDLYKIVDLMKIGSPQQTQALIGRVKTLAEANAGQPIPDYISALIKRV